MLYIQDSARLPAPACHPSQAKTVKGFLQEEEKKAKKEGKKEKLAIGCLEEKKEE